MNRSIYYLLFLLFLITMAILYYLNVSRQPSFWMDEAWDVSVAWSFVKKGIFGNPTYPLDGLDKVFFLHPPFPILLEVPLIKLFGITPLTIHFFPIFCGLGSILILYLLTKRIFDEKVAFWSAIFLAFNPLFFLMSRQLRPEIYVTFFTVLSFYLYRLAKEKENIFFYFLTGISCSLSFLSHYYGAFVMGAFGLLMLYQLIKEKSKVSFKKFILFLIGIFIIVLPFLVWVFKNFEIFKIQFMGSLSNLTGASKLLDTFFKEKERYLKYPEAIGLVGFALIGLVLFLRKILIKAPEFIIFFFLFLLGLALFMPNKAVIYLTPIIPFVALVGGVMLTPGSVFLDNNKLNLAVKVIAFGFLSVSLVYTFNYHRIKNYFKGISFFELNSNFNSIIEKNYQTGKIVGDPTYFLFLDDKKKEEFISEHVISRWFEEKDINQVFKEEKITIFIFSPYWWKEICLKQSKKCEMLDNFLKENGRKLGIIERNADLIDYVYLINNE